MDNQIIKINTDTDGKQTVDARELHYFLELKEQYTDWIIRYVKEDNEYGFIINSDFYRSTCISKNNRVLESYDMTIEMAKELSMLSKTEKGKQARKYFIEMERVAKGLVKELSPEEQLLSQVKMLAQSIELSIETKRKQQELEQRQLALVTKHVEHDVRLDMIEARLQDDPAYFAVTGYANLYKIRITEENAKALGKKAARLSENRGIRIGKTRHGRWGLVNTYHESILKRVFDSEFVTA